MMMMFLNERSEYDEDDVSDQKIRVWWWRCCWSKGQSAEDVADQKVKVLKMLMIKRSKDVDADQRVTVVENWRWRLYDVENLPMIYKSVTLMMLMLSSPTIVVVVVEYPSH